MLGAGPRRAKKLWAGRRLADEVAAGGIAAEFRLRAVGLIGATASVRDGLPVAAWLWPWCAAGILEADLTRGTARLDGSADTIAAIVGRQRSALTGWIGAGAAGAVTAVGAAGVGRGTLRHADALAVLADVLGAGAGATRSAAAVIAADLPRAVGRARWPRRWRVVTRLALRMMVLVLAFLTPGPGPCALRQPHGGKPEAESGERAHDVSASRGALQGEPKGRNAFLVHDVPPTMRKRCPPAVCRPVPRSGSVASADIVTPP